MRAHKVLSCRPPPPSTLSSPPARGFKLSRRLANPRLRREAKGTHDKAVSLTSPPWQGLRGAQGLVWRKRRGGGVQESSKPQRLRASSLGEEENRNPKSWSGRTKKKKKRERTGEGLAGVGLRAPGHPARTAHAPTRPRGPPLLPPSSLVGPGAAERGGGRRSRARPTRTAGEVARAAGAARDLRWQRRR